MKSRFLFGILFACGCLFGDTPTELFLHKHPFSSIQQECLEANKGSEFEKNTPLFLQIIENEKKPGFFGYHASSQNFRIFQDILRAVFEETLNIPIPEDFHFFRIPGGPEYSKIQDKQHYLDLIAPKHPSEEEQKQLIELLILRPVNQEFQLTLKVEDFSQQDLDILLNPLLDARKDIIESWGDTATEPFRFEPPFSPFTQEVARVVFKENCTTEKENWLDRRLHPGLMPSFHLENWRSHSLNENQAVASFLYPYHDERPGQRENVISLNIALFANLMGDGESSLYIYLSGATISGGENKGADFLRLLFEEIGLPSSLVDKLYKMGTESLSPYKEGCFFQFFDLTPHQEYLQNYVYVSAPFGIPHPSITPQDILEGKTPLFTKHDSTYQMRLLITNTQALNPYSSLCIRRYDSVPPHAAQEILAAFKKELRQASVNACKKDTYLKKIKTIYEK